MFKAQRRAFSRSHLAIAPAMLVMAAAAPTFANAQSLFEDWAVNPSYPFMAGSATQAAGPLSTTVSGDFTVNPGATTSGTQTDTANYGNLFTSGSGTANSAPDSAALIYIGNIGPTAVGAAVQYQDFLTITGAGPVTIDLTEVLNAATTPGLGGGAFVSDYFSSAAGFFEIDGSGSISRTITLDPGQQLQLTDYLSAGCNVSLHEAEGSSTCSFQGSAQTYVDVMTQGGGYTSASGTRYLSAPANNGVPEPAAWALMVLGFGGLGAAMRSRRKPVAAA